MNGSLFRYLLLAFGVFLLTISSSLLISSAGLRDNHGISYYQHLGPFTPTFSLGFLLVSLFIFKAARLLPKTSKELIFLRYSLYLAGLLLILVLLTPDYVNSFFNWSHIIVSTLLFFLEFVLAGWFTFRKFKDPFSILLFLILLATGLIAFASNMNLTRYLFISEFAFQTVFFFFLLKNIPKLKLY